MDNSTAMRAGEELPLVIGDEKSLHVKRKPVPFSTPAPEPQPPALPPKEIAVTSTGQYGRQDTLESLPPHYEANSNAPVHSHSTGIVSRLRTRWSLLQKRTRIIIVVAFVAILALVIGLAAGLSHRSRTSNLPLPSNHGGPFSGDLTYYDPGLGACGMTNSVSDSIVAVSHIIFDAVSTSANPNANPLCGKKIRARRNGKSIDLTVVDRCTGCKPTDIDTTTSVFSSLAEIDQGRVTVEWSWLEDVPGAAAGA